LARKILLADDSVTAQNMGRKILADAGYEVIAVNNGSAALKKIAELKPDLVILDVYMPGYSGLEVCQRLKESQETARIPVLLSVGKLEPFKPEEAQRVRADAFIVKPFEASELLSALSKLEDKVVPRAEPSKPGRFARAMAAAEEAGRARKDAASEQNGWSSRIGFPHEKTEAEEKVADDSAIYNPFNRDLRTVVETAAEKAAEKKAEIIEETQTPAGKADEAIVDVAALAPAGLPQDVTPEEVAAIAAAAAQIQMASAAVADEDRGSENTFPAPQVSEPQISGTPVPEATSQGSSEPPSDPVEDHLAPQVHEEAKTEALQEIRIDATVGEGAATEGEPSLGGDLTAERMQDAPVTMAATAESVVAASVDGSRWTAMPVALEGEEATISLEQEMQKAYAAYAPYAAEVADSDSVATLQKVEAATAENSSSPEVVAVVDAAPAENSSSPEVAPVEAHAVILPAAEFAESIATPVPVVESVSSAPETDVADPAGLVAPPAQEVQPWPEAEPVMAETATASSSDLAPVVDTHEPAEESKPDSETVKSTAAAWASWRQIRDTHKDGEVAQSQAKEFEVPEPAPAETAARAVAAGAEQILQEASATPKSDPADVASIVESVLANLRPKLMEEISRKMAEKK